jgi:hypothetical protein
MMQAAARRAHAVLVMATASVLCFLVFAASAQTEREVKGVPGKDVRVTVYIDIKPDCTSGPLPAIRLAVPPEHGRVTVKRGMLKATNLKQCLATEVPAFVVFYRAADAYSGADEFVLEISSAATGRKTLQHFRVNVSGDARGHQDI